LDTKHAGYDPRRWCELSALAKGGSAFKSLIARFLPQNPVEPTDVYVQRRAQAHYRSYMGAIINLYTGWLFAANFSVKPYTRGTTDAIDNIAPLYVLFQEDVSAEVQLTDFVEERFREALAKRCSYW